VKVTPQGLALGIMAGTSIAVDPKLRPQVNDKAKQAIKSVDTFVKKEK